MKGIGYGIYGIFFGGLFEVFWGGVSSFFIVGGGECVKGKEGKNE